MNESTCLACGHALTSARSKAHGYGPRCWSRILSSLDWEPAKNYPLWQVDKARELIEDQGVVALRNNRVWLAVSSDGTRWYRVAANACTCKHGIHSLSVAHCYHTLAARIMARAQYLGTVQGSGFKRAPATTRRKITYAPY